MTFIVETGSGTPGANALASVVFVTQYLTDRGRENENGWAALSTTRKQQCIVAATDYIEQRNAGQFRGSKANLLIAGREASGLLTLSTLPIDGDEFVAGIMTYRLVDALEEQNDVLIGLDIDETIAAMVAAVNLDVTALGVTVEEHTQPNYEALAVDYSPAIAIAARTDGEAGNQIAFSTNIVGADITGAGFLEDGIDEAEQYLSFPRVDLWSADGVEIIGVPLKVRQATAEYAVRAAAGSLNPDPTFDPYYGVVVKKREKVGPIEEETQYGASTGIYLKPYPLADGWLAEYLSVSGGGGEVIRG